MTKVHLTALLALAPVVACVNACSPGAESDAQSSEQAQSSPSGAGSLVVPTPGTKGNPISAADQAIIVREWLKAKAAYYDSQSGYVGYKASNGNVTMIQPGAGQAPPYTEVGQVVPNCPASD